MTRGSLTSMMALVACVATARAIAGDVSIDLRDSAGNPVNDAVIYATPIKGTVPPPPAHTRAQVDQVNKEFVPRVSIVQAGTEIQFPNSDNIRHSIYSFSTAKTFTTKLYSGREAAPVLFDKSGLVVLGCNIHDQMVAWVYVVDTPWFAKSGPDGNATIKGLPPGDYLINAASPDGDLGASLPELHVEAAPLRAPLTLKAAK